MARRAFQVIDVVEVLQHWHAGRPKTVVAASLGVDVKTIRKYVAAAEAEGIRPGDGLVSDRAGWAARVAGWFPELVDAQARSRTWPELEGRRELIAKMLDTNTLATVHQRLRDEHGLSASESSLRRFVGQAFPDRRGARLVTVLRPGAPVGEAQIDYGYLGSWVDPVGGRLRRVQAFVIVLACCRHMFVRPVLSLDQSSWVAAHVAAWEFFGGVALRLVSENVPRNIFDVLWPAGLCGRDDRCPVITRPQGPSPASSRAYAAARSPPRSPGDTPAAKASHSRRKTRRISRVIQSVSRRVPDLTAASTIAATRSGCRCAYARARVTPQEPPTTTQRSTPRCSRSRSMSVSRCPVVLVRRSAAAESASGRLRPHPRWSKSTARYAAGSKLRRCPGPQPDPGPPCKYTAGTPVGSPTVSQWISCPSPTASNPEA